MKMHWIKSAGTGGHIEKEEDFVVEEIISRKFLRKFARAESGVETVSGPYTLALLKKKAMTTRNAIKFLQKELNIKKDNIGYAGLKDKFAVTSQYVTVRGNTDNIKTDKIELITVGMTNKMMQIGELDGNRFVIMLRDCRKPSNIYAVVSELMSRGLPNYFGPQRFGRYGDNHVVGKLILQGNYDKALSIINKRDKHEIPLKGGIDKKAVKFFIHAYQSFLFNKLLDSYVAKHTKPFFGKFPIVGHDTKLKNDPAGKEIKRLLEKDKIKQEDFAIKELKIRCIGSERYAFIKVKKIDYNISGKTIALEFELPKGSYATTLIREVTKTDGYRMRKAL